MLARISGGKKGIRAYLETGKMRGREKSRIELDDRLPLRGDIDLLDAFIEDMQGTAEKYLHVTLAFKEDHLDESVYRKIVNRFEEFAFSSYRKDEYMFYAEAHLPRIKSYINKATGKAVERKPHIHIIIPKRNLLSGNSLNPFGMLYKSSRYIDAFQETLNTELGLASPKLHRRTHIETRADLLARHDGGIPFETGKSLKKSILSTIIRRNISSTDELEKALQAYGSVRRRNPGTDAMYLNIKPPDSSKGFNLKEYVFSEPFLKQPLKDKRRLVSDEEPRYIDRAFGIEPNPALKVLLEEWQVLQSREIKYMNSGNRKEYLRYQALDDKEKTGYLSKKAMSFYARFDRSSQEIPCFIHGSSAGSLEPRTTSVSNPAELIALDRLQSVTNPIARAIEARAEVAAQGKIEAADLFKEIKRNLEPTAALAYAEQHFGIIPGKYAALAHPDRSGRIQCGRRKLNLSDFFTKEIHIPWVEAADILTGLYANQITTRNQTNESSQFWHEYSDYQAYTRAQELKQGAARRNEKSRELSDAWQEYRTNCSAIRSDQSTGKLAKQSQLSILQTKHLARTETITSEPRPQIVKHRQPSLALFLEAQTRPDKNQDHSGISATSAPHARVSPVIHTPSTGWQCIPLFRNLSHTIGLRGSVNYIRNGEVILRDYGQRIIAIQHTDEVLEACLRLAVLKYGPSVQVFGSEDFKSRLTQVAAKRHLRLTFNDPVQEKLRLNMLKKARREREQER